MNLIKKAIYNTEEGRKEGTRIAVVKGKTLGLR